MKHPLFVLTLVLLGLIPGVAEARSGDVVVSGRVVVHGRGVEIIESRVDPSWDALLPRQRYLIQSHSKVLDQLLHLAGHEVRVRGTPHHKYKDTFRTLFLARAIVSPVRHTVTGTLLRKGRRLVLEQDPKPVLGGKTRLFGPATPVLAALRPGSVVTVEGYTWFSRRRPHKVCVMGVRARVLFEPLVKLLEVQRGTEVVVEKITRSRKRVWVRPKQGDPGSLPFRSLVFDRRVPLRLGIIGHVRPRD